MYIMTPSIVPGIRHFNQTMPILVLDFESSFYVLLSCISRKGPDPPPFSQPDSKISGGYYNSPCSLVEVVLSVDDSEWYS